MNIEEQMGRYFLIYGIGYNGIITPGEKFQSFLLI